MKDKVSGFFLSFIGYRLQESWTLAFSFYLKKNTSFTNLKRINWSWVFYLVPNIFFRRDRSRKVFWTKDKFKNYLPIPNLNFCRLLRAINSFPSPKSPSPFTVSSSPVMTNVFDALKFIRSRTHIFISTLASSHKKRRSKIEGKSFIWSL